MGAATLLDSAYLDVEPGAETSCELEIRNTGEIVDQFAIDVVGEVAEWVTVEPTLVNLLPGDDAQVRVTFHPPREPTVRAGTRAFGLRVQSREDPEGSVVEEGTIEVEPFADFAAELVPTVRKGRRRAKFRLVVDNLGNIDAPVTVMGIEPEDVLSIGVSPVAVVTKPGTATYFKVKARPHKTFYRGKPQTHAFQLVVHPDDELEHEPLAVEGSMIQDQLVPKGILRALLIGLVALIALVALWFTVLKPSVQSVAKQAGEQAAKQEVGNAGAAADKANQAADQAKVAASAADKAAGGDGNVGADGQIGVTGDGTRGVTADGANSAVSSFRVEATSPPVTNGSFHAATHIVQDQNGLDITDVVLQNPRGDTGFLRLALGDNVVLEVGLANFRDLDYHYVVPLRLAPDQPLVVSVNCVAPGAGATQCTPSASFSGRLIKPAG